MALWTNVKMMVGFFEIKNGLTKPRSRLRTTPQRIEILLFYRRFKKEAMLQAQVYRFSAKNIVSIELQIERHQDSIREKYRDLIYFWQVGGVEEKTYQRECEGFLKGVFPNSVANDFL